MKDLTRTSIRNLTHHIRVWSEHHAAWPWGSNLRKVVGTWLMSSPSPKAVQCDESTNPLNLMQSRTPAGWCCFPGNQDTHLRPLRDHSHQSLPDKASATPLSSAAEAPRDKTLSGSMAGMSKIFSLWLDPKIRKLPSMHTMPPKRGWPVKLWSGQNPWQDWKTQGYKEQQRTNERVVVCRKSHYPMEIMCFVSTDVHGPVQQYARMGCSCTGVNAA